MFNIIKTIITMSWTARGKPSNSTFDESSYRANSGWLAGNGNSSSSEESPVQIKKTEITRQPTQYASNNGAVKLMVNNFVVLNCNFASGTSCTSYIDGKKVTITIE